MSLIKLLFYLVSFVQVVRGDSKIAEIDSIDCTVPIGSKQDYLAKWPLIFKPTGELYSTFVDSESNEIKIVVEAGDEVLLSCAPNYLKVIPRKEVIKAQCNGKSGNFTIHQSDKSPRTLTCDLRVIEEVTGGIPGCTDETSRFGYVDPIKKTTFLLGEACYDINAGVTKFVHFRLGDATYNYLEEQPKNYLTALRHPDGTYKIELFRGLRFDEIYERIRTSLHTRQIPQLKMAHFIDEPLLSNPQFQAIKKLGWNYFVGYDENETLETLKSNIKDLSKNKNLEVYIGSHGIKELHGIDGSKMEVYLHQIPERFPVPDFLWFVVKSEERAIAFAVRNDADISNTLQESEKISLNAKSFCKNSDCEKISWLSAELRHNNKLICCDVNEFRQNVHEVPVISYANDKLI